MITIPMMESDTYFRIDANKPWNLYQRQMIALARVYDFHLDVWVEHYQTLDVASLEQCMQDAERYLSSLAPIGCIGEWRDGVWGIWEELA